MTKLEEVARAIALERFKESAKHEIASANPALLAWIMVDIQKKVDEWWRDFVPAARAAIEALRRMNEAMQAAKDEIDMSAGTDPIWHAMIDAILSEGE
jgi:nitrogen-specific signal transduction histidine kinase